MTCKNRCHQICFLDKIYELGNLQLQNCAAFGGKTECEKCQHDYSVHTHTTMVRQEVEEDVDEEYFEEETYTITDHNKETLFKQAQEDVKVIQKEIEQLNAKQTQKEKQIQSAYRRIAYLHKQLRETVISCYNEYFLKYLEYRKETAQRNPRFSKEEVKEELAQLAKAEKEYNAVKDLVEVAVDSPLTADDSVLMEEEYRTIEAEQEKVIAGYRGDRNSFHRGLVSKRKSIIFGSSCTLI